MVAQRYGTDHHELIVSPELLEDVLPRLVYQLDEPFADSSAVPTYYVSKLARQFVTVVLSGDGGDEIFGGYCRYHRARLDHAFDWIPLPLRRGLATAIPRLVDAENRLTRVAERLPLSHDLRYTRSLRLIPPRTLAKLIQSDIQNQWSSNGLGFLEETINKVPERDFLTRLQYTDACCYLPEDILVKVDRTSMLNSLETRCPLLDHRLVELAGRIPHRLRYNRGQTKYIFKKTMAGALPRAVLERGKMGFAIPMREWFRDDLNQFAKDVLLSQNARNRHIFNSNNVQSLLDRHQSNSAQSEGPIWALLVFELWCQQTLNRGRAEAARSAATAQLHS
jgi:asparagine synthase (glutamine-hydrolysing)